MSRRQTEKAKQEEDVVSLPKLAFSIRQTAKIISMGVSAVRSLIKDRKILVVRKGRSIIVPYTEIQAFLDREKC